MVCKNCHKKGHFANECPDRNTKDTRNKEQNPTDDRSRAFLIVGLSASSADSIKLEKESANSWYMDSGATQHMSSHGEWMINYKKLDKSITVILGDGSMKPGIGVGDIKLEAFNGKSWDKVLLMNVLHVPTFTFNLFSVITMLDKGYTQSGDAMQSVFKDNVTEETVAIAKRDGNLFKMNFRVIEPENCLMTLSLKQWHEKLAHQNVKYVKDILNRKGIKYEDDWGDYVCPG